MGVFRPITLLQRSWQESHPPVQPVRGKPTSLRAGEPEELAKLARPLLPRWDKSGEYRSEWALTPEREHAAESSLHYGIL